MNCKCFDGGSVLGIFEDVLRAREFRRWLGEEIRG